MAEWYDSPMAQDELMRQKLMGMNLPPEQIEMIMMQIKQAEGLQQKSALTEGIPQPSEIGQGDTLQAQEGWAGPVLPDIGADPGYRPGVGEGGEMLGDLAPDEYDPTGAGGGGAAPGADPTATPAAQQASLMERLGPEGLEIMLNQGGIDEQRASAMALRDKEGPTGIGGIGLSTGGEAYVAANPLSHLASGVEKYRAKEDIKRLREEEKQGNKTMLELLRDAEGLMDDDEDVGLGIGSGFGVA